jgi:hypothetical protein
MHGARDVMRPAQQGAWHCGSESEYAAFRGAALPTLPSVADIELNGHTLVVAGEGGVVRASAVVSPRRDARERRVMPFAIGSAVLSTAVLAVAVVMHGRREVVAPIVLGGTKEPKAPTDDGVERPDPLRAVIEQSVVATTPNTPITLPATTPSTPPTTAPSTPPATTPSTPPATAPSTPPATAPSTPPATAPSTPPATAPSTPPATAPSTPPPVDPPETAIQAFLDLLEQPGREPLRWPIGNSDLGRPIDRQIAEKDRAFQLAKECATQLRFIVASDMERKEKAKNLHASKQDKSSVVAANGFIVQRNENGPGENRRDFLNPTLVARWRAALEALSQRMPLDAADEQLRAPWNNGLADELGPDPKGSDKVVEWLLKFDPPDKNPGFWAELLATQQVLADRKARSAGGKARATDDGGGKAP